jgi:sarcosine oxidase
MGVNRKSDCDVLVVGAGIMGAAAAWRLARRGLRVQIAEQFDLRHTRGSSHGQSRIFRLAYDDPMYIRLAVEALPLWREAEREVGQELVLTTGGVDLGPPENLGPIASALESCDVRYELLSHAELAQRFPVFRTPPDWEALYQSDTGVTHAAGALSGFLTLAERHGARAAEGTRVLTIEPHGDAVAVETSGGTIRAARVVVAAAGWSPRLLAPLGLAAPITTTREHVVYYPAPADTVVPFIWHAGGPLPELYGLPNGGEVKVGEHGTGPVVDPDSNEEIDHERVGRVEELVREHLPSVSVAPARVETCLYAATPDDDFIVDRQGPVVIAFGFGGHGFKFAPIVGELLARLVAGESPNLPRFARARFEGSVRT